MADMKIMLIGGPVHLPPDQRMRSVEPGIDTVKLVYGGGYEHYAASSESMTIDEAEFQIFRWTMRTAIAE